VVPWAVPARRKPPFDGVRMRDLGVEQHDLRRAVSPDLKDPDRPPLRKRTHQPEHRESSNDLTGRRELGQGETCSKPMVEPKL